MSVRMGIHHSLFVGLFCMPKVLHEVHPPIALLRFEFLLQILYYCFVGCLSLSISLGVPRGREAKFNFPPLTEFFEVAQNELGSIDSDYFLGQAESVNYVLPNEAFNVRILYIHKRLCFYPLCKVISEYKQVFTLTARSW